MIKKKKCSQVKKMWPQERNWIRQYKKTQRGNFQRKQIGPCSEFSLLCFIATSATRSGISGPGISSVAVKGINANWAPLWNLLIQNRSGLKMFLWESFPDCSSGLETSLCSTCSTCAYTCLPMVKNDLSAYPPLNCDLPKVQMALCPQHLRIKCDEWAHKRIF